MFNFTFGVVVGVVLSGLGVFTLPKLISLVHALKAKFSKVPTTSTVTTPPPVTPAATS